MKEKEKEILDAFTNDDFSVTAHSRASQSLIIGPSTGTAAYEDIEVYGDTVFIEISDEAGFHFSHEIHQPKDDIQAVLDFAKKWDAAGRPRVEEGKELPDFFKNL